MWRIVFWIVAVVAVVGLIVYSAWPRPREVETVICRTGAIEAFISEEAETRLDDEYVVTMPVAGRLLRIGLTEGDHVDSGDLIAQVDTFERRERLKALQSRVLEVNARIVGVDEAKPKPEDIRASELGVQEATMRLSAAKKALDVARINYEQEKKQYDRLKPLHDAGTVSDSEFDEAQRRFLTLKGRFDETELNVGVADQVLKQADVKLTRLRDSIDDNEYQRSVLKAQIQGIETDMAVVRDELAKSKIRAPVAGPVLEKYQDDEQVLVAGARLLKIGDLRSIRIEADILSEEIGQVRKGRAVEISGPAVGEEPIWGKVERIFPAGFEKISSLGIEQQRVKVIIAFDNSALKLRPAVRVDIRIITDQKAGVLLVPERALFKLNGRWHVFVVREGKAVLAPVKVGLRNDELAEIATGLQAGEQIIATPPADLKAGDAVTPLPGAEPRAGAVE